MRPLAMTGVILVSVSCIACFFSTNMYFLVVFFGCLQGCGMVLSGALLPLLYSISFKKQRSTATGLILISPNIVSCIFSSVGVYILEEYGLRGTFLIMGAFSLHGILGAAVLVQYDGRGIKPNSPNRVKEEQLKKEVSLDVVPPKIDMASNKTSTNEKFTEHIITENRIQSEPIREAAMVSPKVCATRDKCNGPYEFDVVIREEIHIKSGASERKDVKPGEKVLPEGEQDKVEWNQDCGGDKAWQTQKPTQPESKSRQGTKIIWRNTGFMSVLTNPYFLINASSEQVGYALFHILSVVMGDYVNDKGIPLEKIVYILPMLAAGMVLARLALGWVADKNYVSKPTYMAIVSAIFAATVFTLPFVSGFGIIIFCVALCGICLGNLLTLSPILYVEFLPQEVVYIAVAFSYSSLGVTCILTTFIIGAFRDNVGSYDNMFRMNAGLLILCSCLWIIVSIRWRRRSVSSTPGA